MRSAPCSFVVPQQVVEERLLLTLVRALRAVADTLPNAVELGLALLHRLRVLEKRDLLERVGDRLLVLGSSLAQRGVGDVRLDLAAGLAGARARYLRLAERRLTAERHRGRVEGARGRGDQAGAQVMAQGVEPVDRGDLEEDV